MHADGAHQSRIANPLFAEGVQNGLSGCLGQSKQLPFLPRQQIREVSRVPQLNTKWSQDFRPRQRGRQPGIGPGQQIEQQRDVMRLGKLDLAPYQESFETLLNRLLTVTNDGFANWFWVSREPRRQKANPEAAGPARDHGEAQACPPVP